MRVEVGKWIRFPFSATFTEVLPKTKPVWKTLHVGKKKCSELCKCDLGKIIQMCFSFFTCSKRGKTKSHSISILVSADHFFLLSCSIQNLRSQLKGCVSVLRIQREGGLNVPFSGHFWTINHVWQHRRIVGWRWKIWEGEDGTWKKKKKNLPRKKIPPSCPEVLLLSGWSSAGGGTSRRKKTHRSSIGSGGRRGGGAKTRQAKLNDFSYSGTGDMRLADTCQGNSTST